MLKPMSDELNEMLQKLFEEMDADSSGEITKEETTAWFKAWAKVNFACVSPAPLCWA